MHSTDKQAAGGFSLLEMVVAMAVLSLCLTVLYQATSGATRNVRIDEKYAYAVELARSVLANYSSVPAGGISLGGETPGGFNWSAATSPVSVSSESIPPGALHNIEVSVSWNDGSLERAVVLNSVVMGALVP